MRLGLIEMQRFAEKFFPGVHPGTWTDSCGVADLVATCCGGRNFRCAREFVQGTLKGSGESMDAVEASGIHITLFSKLLFTLTLSLDF